MKEFTEKSIDELEKALVEKTEALRMFRFGMSGSKVKNVKAGRDIRKSIAQILTVMTAKKVQ